MTQAVTQQRFAGREFKESVFMDSSWQRFEPETIQSGNARMGFDSAVRVGPPLRLF